MDTRALVLKFGLPIAVLYSARDTEVQLELATGERWKGTVVNVDDSGNVELCNAQQEDDATGENNKVSSAVFRGGAILFAQMLDVEKMRVMWPMLKLVQRGGAGAPAKH